MTAAARHSADCVCAQCFEVKVGPLGPEPEGCTPSRRCGHCDHCTEPPPDLDDPLNGTGPPRPPKPPRNLPEPGADDPPDPTDDEGRPPTSWAPVNLTAALAGADVEPPTMWERTDGACLLYAGRVHWFQGESESCKSWAAQQVVAAELAAGRDGLYLDFEDDERGVVARLRALGAARDAIRDHLVYVRPDEPLRDRHGKVTDGGLDLFAVLDARPYSLAVVDGVTEAMTAEGLDPMSNTDIAVWMRRLPRLVANRGAAVACLDHLPKNGADASRFAIGGQHKLAGLTGAAYRFTTLRPLGRALGSEPVEGTVAIAVVKDRPGWVRGRSPDGQVGTLELTAWPDGGVTTRLVPPSDELPADLIVCRRVLGYLADYDGVSQRQVRENVTGDVGVIAAALRWMATPERSWLRIERKGRSHLHWLTDAGRAELADGP